jgi:saccharopine dehydrogenase-like NADP-dependent oxidoreductase
MTASGFLSTSKIIGDPDMDKLHTVKNYSLIALSVLLFLLVAAIQEAPASESLKEFTVDSAVSRVDRNGNQYVRFIVEETRSLQGVSYTVGVPVMAFGELAAEAAKYPAGSQVKAIVRHSTLNDGRESYSIIAFVQ